MDQGAWYQIQHHLLACMPRQSLSYAGRIARRACGGHSEAHVAEQAQLVADALVNPLNGDTTIE